MGSTGPDEAAASGPNTPEPNTPEQWNTGEKSTSAQRPEVSAQRPGSLDGPSSPEPIRDDISSAAGHSELDEPAEGVAPAGSPNPRRSTDPDAQSERPSSRVGLVGRPAGRAFITLFVAWWIVATIGWSMPPGSHLRTKVVEAVEPGVHAFGLDQSWVVFSPNPPREVVMVQATVTFADGSVATWQPPREDPFIGHFNGYHWQKWEERVRLDENADMWPATAAYIADDFSDQGTVVSVVLSRRWYQMPPVGDHSPPVWESYDFYDWTPQQPGPPRTEDTGDGSPPAERDGGSTSNPQARSRIAPISEPMREATPTTVQGIGVEGEES